MSKRPIQRGGSDVVTDYFNALPNTETILKPMVLATLPKVLTIKRGDKEVAKRRDETFRQAYDEGYQIGLDRGMADGLEKGLLEGFESANKAAYEERQRELVSFVDSLTTVLAQADEAMMRWYAMAEEEIGSVVADLAHRVVLDELKIGRESILAMVKESMSEISHASEARIRVNPLDTAITRTYLDEIKACAASVKNIEVVDDPTIEGGCVIETDGGLVDGRIEHKIEVLKTMLKEAA